MKTSWPELVPQKIKGWGGWPDDVVATLILMEIDGWIRWYGRRKGRR